MSGTAPLVDAAIQAVMPAAKTTALKVVPKMYNRARDGFVRTAAGKDDTAKRAALRGLYIAMPAPMCEQLPDSTISAYDAVLRAEVKAATLTIATDIPQVAPGLSVWQGDMSRLVADAVVNPCNNALLGCFLPAHKCLDNILHGAAGPRLRIACAQKLRSLNIDEDVNGQCRVTPGFELPATHVFHTVGPCLVQMGSPAPPRAPTPVDRAELKSCYETCYAMAQQMGLKTIAFCCISTGIFGYPADEAAQIAVTTVRKMQLAAAAKGDAVPLAIFNVFKDEDLDIYNQVIPAMLAAEKAEADTAAAADE